MIRSKAARLRLDPLSYESLRQHILRGDGWRCQSCGTISNLEVHHGDFRSHSGADAEENLITLCSACHTRVHRRYGHKRIVPDKRQREGRSPLQ
jgi:5-methylcytosine-specific restriction endonuclease McrA